MTTPTTTLPDGTPMPVFGLGTWMMGERSDRLRQEVDTIRAACAAVWTADRPVLGLRVADELLAL